MEGSLSGNMASFLSRVPAPYAVLFFLAALVSLVAMRVLARAKKTPQQQQQKRTPAAADKKGAAAPARVPGEWTPSSFRMPTPPPYPDWSLERTKPLPYRAFRYGPKYNVTMGLRSARPEDWIQLDSHYPRFHADKARRLAERGPKCCRTAPEAAPAARELLAELAAYLPARYPSLFRRDPLTGRLDNLWSGESFDIAALVREDQEGGEGVGVGEDPMATCARLVQDDLAIMIERPDGQYYLLAGAVLLAGFWRLEDKVGLPLSAIHTSGDVPQYAEKLERGMMNFFRRLRCDELYCRNNYFVQVDDDLAWSWSIGSEDSADISWNTAEKNRAVEHHYFRSERQSLRRLPKTGAVVFTIRTYFHPITEIAQEDFVPGRLASGIRSWGPDVKKYKGYDKYGEVLLEYLDKEHQKQLDRGLDLSKEDDVRQYPW